MKILAVMGSPRKNSDTLRITQQVETRLKELGEVDFEYLTLNETPLELCKGCFVCTLKGEEYCPLKDDRSKIEEKMLNSDGVIFASPAYVHNVSWLMKNFIDRFNFVCHRPRFFDQKALLISTNSYKEIFEADDKYWAANRWLDKKTKYFYDTKVGFFKNLFALFMERQIKRMMDKGLERPAEVRP